MSSSLWWVSVGGHKCEPARIVKDADGAKTCFTIGCPDGTLLTDECGVILVGRMETPPLTPRGQKAQKTVWEKKIAADKEMGIHHGYRRFD